MKHTTDRSETAYLELLARCAHYEAKWRRSARMVGNLMRIIDSLRGAR
jgi:hypothetical protein